MALLIKYAKIQVLPIYSCIYTGIYNKESTILSLYGIIHRKSVFWHILCSVFVLNKFLPGLTVKNVRKCLKKLLNSCSSNLAKNFFVVSHHNHTVPLTVRGHRFVFLIA